MSGTHPNFDREQQTSREQPTSWQQTCWLKQLKRLADRREETTIEVQRARAWVDEFDDGSQNRDRVLTPGMEAAVERLQAAMAAQDRQWRRQIMLNMGIFVYDDDHPNAGKSFQLDVESRPYIFNQLAQNYSP